MLVKNINGINHIKLTPHRINCSISFKGGEDSFAKIPRIIDGDLTTQEVNEIIETINNKPAVAKGYSSNIFNIGNKKIIKALKKERENDMFSKGQIEGEYIILKRIQEKDPSVAVNPLALIRHGNKDILVEEFISDTSLKDKKITSEIMDDLLEKFTHLDKEGIINYDLHAGNILLTKENRPKLIDFGASGILTSNPYNNYLPSEILPLVKESENLSSLNIGDKKNFIKTFLSDIYPGAFINSADNPYFNIYSNTTNFEHRCLYKHLLDNIEDEPIDFFKEYLKSKAEIYHKGIKELLNDIKLVNAKTQKYPPEEAKLIKEKIEKAIKYEDLSIKALSNPTEDVMKTEVCKLQLRRFMNPYSTTRTSIKNECKIKSAFEQLIDSIENGIKNNDGELREYFIETDNWIKSIFKDWKFDANQVEIPFEENLLNTLFQKTENVSTNNKNIKLLIGVGTAIAVTIGGIGLIVHKNKKKNAQTPIQPQIQPQGQLDVANIFKEIEK